MASNNHISLLLSIYGGEGGIRTPGRSFGPYNGLANRRIQPLCHLSGVWFQQFIIEWQKATGQFLATT
jgi:hypothetical protein